LTLILNADGTGKIDDESMKYVVKDNVLSVDEKGSINRYAYQLNGNRMTLSGGDLDKPMVFERQAPPAPSGLGARRAQPPAAATPEAGGTGLVGRWQGPQGITQINADGTMLINDVPYRYIVQGSILTVVGSDGSAAIPFQLRGDSLTITSGGQSAVLQRMAANAPAAGQNAGSPASAAELAGKWCAFSNFNANAGGGSMTDECFTLNANGSYSYHREASMSAYAPGIWGGTTSRTDDAGTFQLLGTRLTVNSRTQGTKTYNLEKRNHPKNGDAMLCLEGTCFVTAYQRPPWR
jgi:hypothetical protein